MINFLLVILEIIICYTVIIYAFKKYNFEGLYFYSIISVIILSIMAAKRIDIMGINIPLGFVLSTSLIIVGNIITQKKGPGELKTYIILLLATIIISSCFINISRYITNSQYTEASNISFNNLFETNIRICLAIATSTITSIWLNSQLYYRLKKTQNKIIVSNTFSITIISLLESIIFLLIAYPLEYPFVDFILCVVFVYIIKLMIGIIGTIPIYITNKYN